MAEHRYRAFIGRVVSHGWKLIHGTGQSIHTGRVSPFASEWKLTLHYAQTFDKRPSLCNYPVSPQKLRVDACLRAYNVV